MSTIAAAGEEGDGDKPGAGKGRKAAARKAKPVKRVGGVLSDYLLPDVASVDVESEAGRPQYVMHMRGHHACCLTVHRVLPAGLDNCLDSCV